MVVETGERKVERRSTQNTTTWPKMAARNNITLCETIQKGQTQENQNKFWFKTMFCKKNEAGFLQVNNTDQARVQFTGQASVAQVVGE